jgi:predicted house-cleaning noncanonical NTP pyrophosphatase (MazG superfamily)
MSFKMVRDRHQEILQDKISGQWRISPDPVSSLLKKLGEEYGELIGERNPAELYDVLDVLDELISLMDPGLALGLAHQDKLDRFGDFSSHLEWHPFSDLSWENTSSHDHLVHSPAWTRGENDDDSKDDMPQTQVSR